MNVNEKPPENENMHVKIPVKGNNINNTKIRVVLAEKWRCLTCDVWCEIENIKTGFSRNFSINLLRTYLVKSFIEFSFSDSERGWWIWLNLSHLSLFIVSRTAFCRVGYHLQKYTYLILFYYKIILYQDFTKKQGFNFWC